MLIMSLMPLFLGSRTLKWYLLVRQHVPANFKKVVAGYFWGMALGAVTPARSGEFARVWAAGLPSSCVVLFLLEKLIEVYATGNGLSVIICAIPNQ